MAEVLVSTQTISNIMLHSPSDPYHTASSGQSHHNASRGQQVPRSYSTQNAGVSFRPGSAAPVAPYAFQTTPHLRQETRTTSAPSYRQPGSQPSLSSSRNDYAPSSAESTASSTSASNSSTGGHYSVSKDDSVITAQRPINHFGPRPSSTFLTSSSTPDLSLVNFDASAKPSPDRYRRVQRRTDSGSSVTTQQTLEGPRGHPSATGGPPAVQNNGSKSNKSSTLSGNGTGGMDEAQRQLRYRRRSVGTFEPSINASTVVTPVTTTVPTWSQVVARGHAGPITPVISSQGKPISYHQRNNSNNSTSSTSSTNPPRPSSARYESPSRSTKSNSPPSQRPKTAPAPRATLAKSNADMSKRIASPSPLSNPVSTSPEKESTPPTIPVEKVPQSPQEAVPQPAHASQSPAVQQLHAIQDPNKGVKSRLRRAFSFGSAQELRKASAENAGRAKLHKEMPEPAAASSTELGEEDAAIAAKQEAGGIGAGIYSGQGVVYGSTDNLSISSTASSASIMLRKMGKGMKKSTRSLKGLFRPKSIIGVPAADSAVNQASAASAAEVSLVTVEAERERERVNVNLDPHDQPGGGTGFPKLERNSMDVSHIERPSTARNEQHDSVSSRKSIVGGEKERQEVLAAVKKGILKRAITSPSTASLTVVDAASEHNASGIPSIPSIPCTPDELGETMEKEYFIAASHFASGSTRSLPERGGIVLARSISWNPKVQFHEVYTANEYDRRGEIATCNRLTPMLAQQIKEELNSFKMEMEVHEESKPHTHFF